MEYKQQRNMVVQMNRKAKYEFYQSIKTNSIENEKQLWKAVKPMGDKIILVERDESISDEELIAECLNSHFVNITDSL